MSKPKFKVGQKVYYFDLYRYEERYDEGALSTEDWIIKGVVEKVWSNEFRGAVSYLYDVRIATSTGSSYLESFSEGNLSKSIEKVYSIALSKISDDISDLDKQLKTLLSYRNELENKKGKER